MRIIALFVFAFGGGAPTIVGFFRRLGVFGPFLFEALDSSFLYLPLANELLLLSLISADESRVLWAVYAVAAAVGSVAGVALVDLLARRVGEEGLEKFVSAKRVERIKQKLASNSGWVIFIASACPPPFPFRAVVLTASALQSPRLRLLATVFCGRLVRFITTALLILYFGRMFLDYLNSRLFEHIVYGLMAIAVVGSIFVLRKWLSH